MDNLVNFNVFYDDSALFYSERKDYLEYKKGNLEVTKFSDKLKYEILGILEKNGFSADGLGIYYYKDVIVRIIKRLEWLDSDGYYFILGQIDSKLIDNMSSNELEQFIQMNLNKYLELLKGELKNPYSQFYFDIARNDNDISTKVFHSYIVKSFECLSNSYNCFDVIKEKDNFLEGKVDYGKLAFEMAEYIRTLDFYKNSTEEKEKLKPMIKVKI